MVNYGLAPEKPFPNGLRDAISAYLWLIEPEDGKAPRHDPRSIVLAGDSAGGNLVIALLL
jgi:acetyl esterase/lipase